jgi:RNA polymerase sigma factor (sigma-70 family)
MHPRQSIIEIFSTFVQFEGDRFHNWATDAKLRRSMLLCTRNNPHEQNENFWILYWYKYMPNPELGIFAQQHLTAYLQEACYWASQKTSTGFTSSQYKLSDCFQIAIAKVDKILKAFNPNQGFTLRNYASTSFACSIRENLRQRHEVDICTPWGLLRKISQKRLVESLEAVGLSKDRINFYIIAWNCFKTLYLPNPDSTTRTLARPDAKVWEAIAQTYNSQSSQKATPEILETWLLDSAKYARRYLYPNTDSLNNLKGSDDSSEWLDNLQGSESVLTQIIATQEEEARFSQQTEINTILVNTLAQLEIQSQQMLKLWYRQGLTQQQIAKQLDIPQYTVSRRFTKIRETLVKAVASWSQEKMHISLTPDILKEMIAVIEEWLQSNLGSGE